MFDTKLLSKREIRAITLCLPLIGIFIIGAIVVSHENRNREGVELTVEMEEQPAMDSIELFKFDPNRVEYADLRKLGLPKHIAVSMLKYRASGKIFRIKEDVALCYGFTDSMYFRLEPYIDIARKYRITPQSYRTEQVVRNVIPVSKFRIDTVTSQYLQAIGALSRRQAATFLKWRTISGINNIEEFRECYVVSDSLANALEPYIIFPTEEGRTGFLVDINSADSLALLDIYGIGEKTANRIIEYRKRLGGFYSVEQLAEVKGVTESNYEKILLQIRCDNCDITKIDVNFASANVISGHPYIPPTTLRKLLKTRQLKGGWSTAEEMIEDKILTEKEAKRLAPYLQFRTPSR